MWIGIDHLMRITLACASGYKKLRSEDTPDMSSSLETPSTLEMEISIHSLEDLLPYGFRLSLGLV